MSTPPTPSLVNYDELHDHLVTEFKECRTQITANVDRLRKIADAIIVCNCGSSRQVDSADFTVNQLINDLKTVERYLKREMNRVQD